jgi:signal transduction histidine kinase
LIRTAFDPALGWTVDVIDNGPGVNPEDREKIFSLFESRKGMRGTGLGLPVSAKIMREHGGEILVLDATDGPGTCFRIHLPTDGTSLSELCHRDTMI